jgi:plastocyanin
MHFSTLFPISLSLAASVLGQTDLSAASATVAAVAAPSAAPAFSNSTSGGASAVSNPDFQSPAIEKVWVVKVGSSNGTFNFAPNTIKALPGDWVQFQFEPRVC